MTRHLLKMPRPRAAAAHKNVSPQSMSYCSRDGGTDGHTDTHTHTGTGGCITLLEWVIFRHTGKGVVMARRVRKGQPPRSKAREERVLPEQSAR